jgi:hypothetical protein
VFGEQLQVRAVEEDGVVSDDRDLSTDGRRSDPEVSEVLLLMQGMAEGAALVPEPGVRPRRLGRQRPGRGFGAEGVRRRRGAARPSRPRWPYRTSATACCATVIRRPNTCLL